MEPIKYFQIRILTLMDFTDSRLLELRKINPTLKEYSAIFQQLEIKNDNSSKVLHFLSNYDNGFLIPEKCDANEPIRKKFDPTNLDVPISWLSQPGGGVFLKKNKSFKYDGVIENQRNAPIWEGKNSPLLKANDPYYLGEVRLFIDRKIIKLKSEDYLFEFFNKLFEVMNGEYAYIKNPEGNIITEKGKFIETLP